MEGCRDEHRRQDGKNHWAPHPSAGNIKRMPIEQVNVNKPSAFFRCVHVLHWRRVQDEFPGEECVRYVAISGREYLECGNSSAILCKMHRSNHLEFALKMPKSSSYLQTVSQSHLIIYMIEDWLVVWNSFFFKHILGIYGNFIIPTDELIFLRGEVNNQPVI